VKSIWDWIGGAVALVFALLILSAFLYGVAPIAATVGGLALTFITIDRLASRTGKFGFLALLIVGIPIMIAGFGGLIYVLLSAPTWLLMELGVWKK